MSACRKHAIRRIHRETGKPLRAIVRAVYGLTALEILAQYQRIRGALA